MCERKKSYEKSVVSRGKEPYEAYSLIEIDVKERKRREREERSVCLITFKEDLFIVSATAVVHHPADGSPSKCYSLSEWM